MLDTKEREIKREIILMEDDYCWRKIVTRHDSYLPAVLFYYYQILTSNNKLYVQKQNLHLTGIFFPCL